MGPCKKKLLADRQIDRPFVELPIRDPQMMNHHTNHDCRKHSFVKPSAKDEENLIRVGLLVSTLISADNTTSPAIPTHMDKYTISEIRLNNRVCKAYTGRFIRYQATLKPARHAVAWIESSSPIIEIISKEVHQKLSCGLGPQSYINGIHVAGFCATGLMGFIKDQIGACETCAQTKMLMKGDSTIAQTMKKLYGPDDFLGLAASANPLSILSCDEAGPFYIQDQRGGYKTTHILACVEIITYKVHLIPLPKLDTLHFVRALEILQSLRGKFSTLIMDDHTSHRPLSQTQHEEQQVKQSMLESVIEKGHASFLATAGIKIVVASPKRHEKLGRAEFIVKRIKIFLASSLKTWAFSDSFDFQHKVSLITPYLNERPVFHTPQGVLTPYSLEQAMLKRSPAKPRMLTFAEFIVPSDKQVYRQIIKMATFSKKIIFEVATATALHLLNKKNLHNKLKVGELVYIPDRLLRKHPNSIRDALGKIIEVASSTRDYLIQTLDGDIMKRHYSDLINANTTKNQGEVMLIDPFQIVDVKSIIVPESLYPRFKLQLDKFRNDTSKASPDEPDEPDELDIDEAGE